MLKFIFGLVFVVAASFLFIYCENKEMALEDIIAPEELAYEKQESLQKLVNEINSNDINLDSLLAECENFENKDVLQSYVQLKQANYLFSYANKKLKEVFELHSIISKKDATHKLVLDGYKDAVTSLEKARKIVDNLNELKDNNYNHSLSYLRGCIYYKMLEYVSDEDNAQELFNQTLTHFKSAIKYRPNDINTVINIELLIKNQENLGANASKSQKSKRKQMLNSMKAGLNKGSGN